MRALERRLKTLEGGKSPIRAQLEAMTDDEIRSALAELEERTCPQHFTGTAAGLVAELGLPNPIGLDAWRGLDASMQIRLLEAELGPEEAARLYRLYG